ncbi:MAG: sensor histidine kinase [Clostridia bacterium]
MSEGMVAQFSDLQNQREREYSLEMLKKEAELNALQSQINPHFLYNTLDSIRGQLVAEGMTDAADILEALSKLFRYSINPKTVYNTLEQELDNIDNYMRILHYRFGDRIAFSHVIEGDVAFVMNCEMPKLTLQPIVENAVQHGMEHREEDGRIVVRAAISEKGLHICVEDNGAGIAPERLDELNKKLSEGAPIQKTQGSGIALINVNERIRMLYGEYYGLYVYSDEGIGTEVHIWLPVQRASAVEVIEHTRGEQ